MHQTLVKFSLTFMFSISVLSVVFAQEKWTPEKIMEYKNISETNISPDGKFVAYVVRIPVMTDDKSEYNSQIWVAAIDGSFNVQYTRGEKSSNSPKFSPDSKKIAFVSSRNEDKNQIFIMRLMGGEAEQITNAPKSVGSFKWSPDGKTIAYLMSDPETEEEKNQKKGKTDVIIVDADYKYNHLYTVSVEKKEQKRDTQRLTTGEFHVRDFDWSPDGSTIVFSHSPTPRINDLGLQANISMVKADSSEVVNIIDRPGTDYNPRYSPDGKSLIFQSSGGKPERVGLNDFYKYDFASGKYEALNQTPNRQSSFVSWINNDAFLLTEPYKTSTSVFTLPAQKDVKIESGAYPAYTETGLPLLTSTNGTIGSVSVSISGNAMCYVYEEPGMAEEIYISDLKGANVKKLTAVNAEFNPPKTAKTELISWNSKDGMKIEGLLTYPVDFEKGKKYPVILQIHGGPGGVFTKGYTGSPSIYMTQFFAENGFIVLRPNPRGSTGYGKEFRYANIKDWGYGDYQDLMTGVDYVLDMGIADKNNQFVMGWSYGGYMTSWVVTQTNRFNAASMGAGLPNLISMTTTTDIPDYLVDHMGGKEFWEDYEAYERHSAMYFIKNVQTPTQVIHGANDLRVPFTQGQEFYGALKRKGVDTEMIVYPRTPHGPREPKFLMDVSPRILNWFNKYLSK